MYLAIIDKRRPAPENQKLSSSRNVKGKHIIVDDIIDLGGTTVNATNALIVRGAKEYMFIFSRSIEGKQYKKLVTQNKKISNNDTINN